MTDLPGLVAFTDRSQVAAGRTLVEQVAEAVAAGLRVVVLRERDLPPAERRRLAEDLRRVLSPHGGLLIAASPYLAACAGVHLRRDDPGMAVGAPEGVLVGRSCHDASELRRAAEDRADYVTLSPVARSLSKPGYGPPLGERWLRDAIERVPGAPPVFALGGVTPQNAQSWREAGAHGVAVMGALMRATDPAAVVRALDVPG